MIDVPEYVKDAFKSDSTRKKFRIHFTHGEYRDITNYVEYWEKDGEVTAYEYENDKTIDPETGEIIAPAEDRGILVEGPYAIVSESVTFTESICSQNQIKLGLCESNKLEFECVKLPPIKDMTIEASIDVYWSYDESRTEFMLTTGNVFGAYCNDVFSKHLHSYYGEVIHATIYINVLDHPTMDIEINGDMVEEGLLMEDYGGSVNILYMYKDEYLYYFDVNHTAILYKIIGRQSWDEDEIPPIGSEYYMFTLEEVQYISDPIFPGTRSGIYTIPYGKYIVQECKRSATDLTRRRVVAYESSYASASNGSSSTYTYAISDLERMKLKAPIKSKTKYEQNMLKFFMSNFDMYGLASTMRDTYGLNDTHTGEQTNRKSTTINFLSWTNSRYLSVVIFTNNVTAQYPYNGDPLINDPEGLYVFDFTYDDEFERSLDAVYDYIQETYIDANWTDSQFWPGIYNPKPRSKYKVPSSWTRDKFKLRAQKAIQMYVSMCTYDGDSNNIYSSDYGYIGNPRVVYPYMSGYYHHKNHKDNMYLKAPTHIRMEIRFRRYYPGSYRILNTYPGPDVVDFYPLRTGFKMRKIHNDAITALGLGLNLKFDRQKVRFFYTKNKKGYSAEYILDEWEENHGEKIRNYLQGFMEILGKFGRQDRETGEFEIISLKDAFNSWYPAQPNANQPEPDGEILTLYPANNIYPTGPAGNVTTTLYRSLWWDDFPVLPFGRVRVTYTPPNENEQTTITQYINGFEAPKEDVSTDDEIAEYRYILTLTKPDLWDDRDNPTYSDYYKYVDGRYTKVTGSTAPIWQPNMYYEKSEESTNYLTYDVSQNAIINDFDWTEEQIDTMLDNIGAELTPISYYPCEMNIIGLPYLEAGDVLQVIAPSETFQTIMLRRTIRGIQALQDMIEVR